MLFDRPNSKGYEFLFEKKLLEDEALEKYLQNMAFVKKMWKEKRGKPVNNPFKAFEEQFSKEHFLMMAPFPRNHMLSFTNIFQFFFIIYKVGIMFSSIILHSPLYKGIIYFQIKYVFISYPLYSFSREMNFYY